MFRRICNFLMGIILLILVVLAGVLIIPRLLGYQSLAVLSGSMEPEISVGSVVYVKSTEPGELQVGDIITYRLSGDTMVTHRIEEINREDQTVITKGDANETEDGSPISFSDIVGKAAFHLPWIGYISIYIKTPIGIGVICGVLIVIILLNFLPDILEHEEESEKTK